MEKAIPVLPADDLSAAKHFYVDGLGFRVTFEESDGTRAASWRVEARHYSASPATRSL